MNYLYYKITKGPIKKITDAYLDAKTKANILLMDFLLEVGASEKGVWMSGEQVCAVSFPDDKAPNGWKHVKRGFMPTGHRHMKAVKDQLTGFRIPDQKVFHKMLTRKDAAEVVEFPYLCIYNCQMFGGKDWAVVMVPVRKGKPVFKMPVGNGAREITMSEYLKLADLSKA